jgi:hypothetical protein
VGEERRGVGSGEVVVVAGIISISIGEAWEVKVSTERRVRWLGR